MVKCASLLIGLLILPLVAVGQTHINHYNGPLREDVVKASTNQTRLPSEITLVLEVRELPGRDNPKSFWEAGYEIRLVDWRTIVDLTKTGGDVRGAGTTVSESSFAHRGLSLPDYRRFTISVPVKGQVLERLRQQQQNPQAFSLVSRVRVYDAQLERNFAFKIDRIWQFKLFPDGQATITISIKPDGAFDISGPIPKTLPPGYVIVGSPGSQKPTAKP